MQCARLRIDNAKRRDKESEVKGIRIRAILRAVRKIEVDFVSFCVVVDLNCEVLLLVVIQILWNWDLSERGREFWWMINQIEVQNELTRNHQVGNWKLEIGNLTHTSRHCYFHTLFLLLFICLCVFILLNYWIQSFNKTILLVVLMVF